MASYAGFSRTNYGAQGGEDGGGFLGASQQGSQGGGSKYADESLRPVTIKQIVDCDEAFPGADLTLDGAPVTSITVVGQVRTINPQPTNITYRLDDGTATMDVKKWVDPEKVEDSEAKFAPDAYVRVWGRLKIFNGKKHIGANFMRAIEDFNEVNYHLLEATYVHLYFTKGAPATSGGAGATGASRNGDDAMFLDSVGGGQAADRVKGCSAIAQKMFHFLSNAPCGNEGVHLNSISTQTGMSTRDVIKAGDELYAGGLIYTTVDDETWAVLE